MPPKKQLRRPAAVAAAAAGASVRRAKDKAKAKAKGKPPMKARGGFNPLDSAMGSVVERLLAKFTSQQRTTLKNNFNKLGRLRVGGGCSGSNIMLYALHTLTSALMVQPVQELYTCESVPRPAYAFAICHLLLI